MTEVSTKSASEPVHPVTEAHCSPSVTIVSDTALKVTFTVIVMSVALMVLAVTQLLHVLFVLLLNAVVGAHVTNTVTVCCLLYRCVALCSVLSVQVNWCHLPV